MSLEQHTSLQNALTFAPHIGFFSSIVPRDQIARGDEGNILVQRMNHYLSQARELLDKPRT